jgi:hypothetical protein
MGDTFQSAGNVTALGLVFLLCMGVLVWALPRRQAVAPLLITTCYMPLGQMIMIGSLHFPFFRILLVVGLCRVCMRREGAGLELTSLDKIFGWWAVATLVLGTLASPSSERFINRAGEVFNALGTYILFRCWVRDSEELFRIIRFLAVMIVPLAGAMIVEKVTGRNLFYVLGGVGEHGIIRDGKMRCQGAFRHPILAGTYAATLLPLFMGLWFGRRGRGLAILGGCSALVATLTAESSGAALAMLSGLIGFAFWQVRHHMRLFRWAVVCALVGLALVMNSPVWFLIARVSDFTGGTGWHRSYLIDQAVRHFNEWWLVGSTYTAHWGPGGQVLAADPNNMDITNHYIAEGLGGGVLKLGLFIAMIVSGFKTVGRWVHASEAVPASTRICMWSIGVCLITHCVSFISISYFDQIVVMWYWLLAVISMLAYQLHGTERVASCTAGADQGWETSLQGAEPTQVI